MKRTWRAKRPFQRPPERSCSPPENPPTCRRLRNGETRNRTEDTTIFRDALWHGVEPPMPAEQVALAIAALVDGLAFERVVDPASVPDELFGRAASGLIAGLLGRGQSHERRKLEPRE